MAQAGSFHRFRLETNEPPKNIRTAKKRRTKTGCLTCRTRRKKCDELKPTCVACRRNYLTCKWPDAKPVVEEGEEGGSSTDSSENNLDSQLAKPSRVARLSPSPSNSTLPFGYKMVDSYLLEHYLHVTAHQLSGLDQTPGAFLVCLIPLAYQDGKVLEGLMAVSGAHLSSHSERFEHDARSHYAVTIRNVKHELSYWRTLDSSVLTGLLTTTLLLCYFEAVIGNTKGTIFHHLRASRTILLELRSRNWQEVDPVTLDFLTEWYSFTAISANVTLTSELDREIPMDDFLCPGSLESLNKGTSSYGILFGSAHKLMGLIMPIRQAALRLSRDHDPESVQRELHAFESSIFENGPDELSANPSALEIGAAIYQQALLAFLYTTFHGTSPPTEELYLRVDPCVNGFFELVQYILPGSAVITTLMWPSLVIGSCIRDTSLQMLYVTYAESLTLKMGSVQRMREVLASLWTAQAENPQMYGPYGLELIMRQKDINICIA